MKVGVFLSDINKTAGGGYTFESDIIEAFCALVEINRHDFVILTKSNNIKELEVKSRHKIIEIITIPGSAQILNRLSKGLRRIGNIISPLHSEKIFPNHFDNLIRKNGIQLLWFPTPVFEETDIPYIFTLWDLEHIIKPFFPEVSARGEWENRNMNYSKLLKRAAVVIVGTKIGAEEIERYYQVPTERIRVLPLPTPAFALNPKKALDISVRKKLNIPDKYLFYPAQFWPHKNHANLLHAIYILKEKYSLSIPVVFVGSDKGNKTYILKIIDEMGLSKQVYLLGFVTQNDLIELYREAFALIYVSMFGPDNIPPLEAFALGTPVIAANVQGAEEQLGDAAVLVNPRIPEEIADAIYSFYLDPDLREKLIKKGRERALRWSAHEYVRSIFSIIDELEPIRRCWD